MSYLSKQLLCKRIISIVLSLLLNDSIMYTINWWRLLVGIIVINICISVTIRIINKDCLLWLSDHFLKLCSSQNKYSSCVKGISNNVLRLRWGIPIKRYLSYKKNWNSFFSILFNLNSSIFRHELYYHVLITPIT